MPNYSIVELLPQNRPLHTRLMTRAKNAEVLNQNLFVYVGHAELPPCAAFDDALTNPRLQAAIDGVQLIRIDVSDWVQHEQIVNEAGIATSTVPAFYEIGLDGLATGRKITGAAWTEDTAECMAPPLEAFFRDCIGRRLHRDGEGV